MPSLRAFQREDVDLILKHGLRALVASSPGVGKTIIAISSIVEAPHALPALIVCPASVTFNWAREWSRWSPSTRVIVIEDGSSPIPRLPGAVYIISWALLDARWPDLLRLGLRTIVGDEAHFCKNVDALRSQALYHLTRQVPYLLLLTGTPIVNVESELLVLKELLGPNPLMIRRLLEDVAPDIPPKKRSYVPITLHPEHRMVYDKADADFETWLRSRQVSLSGAGMTRFDIERTLAAEALTKIGYLRRLVGEYKVPAAIEWIARAVRIGEPVIMFCEHQNVLRKLSKGLRKQRIRHGVLDGNTSPKVRQDLVDRFQRHEFPVFIGTKAAKEGITLTAARNVLFIERFYTSAEEEQSEDRSRRIGQKRPTTMWYLHAYGTVDDRIDTIVRTKRQVIRAAIGARETAETPLGNVSSLLRSWAERVQGEQHGPPTALGFGKPLPPLPRVGSTHGVIFSGERWTPTTAARWCRMFGYPVRCKVDLDDRFKLVVLPSLMFKRGEFKSFTVCKDIKIILGRRVSRENERVVRRSLGLTSSTQ